MRRKRGGPLRKDENAEDRLAALESVWYEIIEAVIEGRTAGLVCPECHAPEGLTVEEAQGRAIITCPSCKRTVEAGIATA